MKKIIFGLSVAGLLFSGYMSGIKFFRHICAFNEPCPYVLGYPACYFGFIMYVVLAVFAAILVFSQTKTKMALNWIIGVSILGMLFAGNFAVQELPLLLKNGFRAYALGLPTCALGLIFYVLIFIFSFWKRMDSKEA